MPTIALEGTGSSISFATSVFTSDLVSLTLPEKAREVIETSHLGTIGAKTYKPAKLKNVGSISCEFDHNPAADDLTDNDPEVITINYPLLTGQTTPAKLTFTGFVTSQGGEEMKIDQRMTTKVTIQVNGDMTFTPAS
jgi:hypothetical protein